RDGWELVSRHAREQLATALSQRIEGSGYEDGERAQLLEGGMQMIDQGTAPDPANFDQFEPVLDAGGRISAIRFVFPPYQVGPYSDGLQPVVLPASGWLPVVGPGYRGLFEGGWAGRWHGHAPLAAARPRAARGGRVGGERPRRLRSADPGRPVLRARGPPGIARPGRGLDGRLVDGSVARRDAVPPAAPRHRPEGAWHRLA